jgi:sulfonate transport system substrate-binding protein
MKRILRSISAAAIGGMMFLGAAMPAKAQPVEIRMAYGGVPGIISPLVFLKPEILKHYGKTYTVKSTYIAATSVALQGIASGDFDMSYMSFTALASAILNGGIDMKVISDITRWGSEGHQSVEFVVKEDSGINSVADLKGKIIAVTARGTGFHYAIVEVGRAAMDAALREDRVHMIVSAAPFLFETERKGGTKRIGKPEDVMGEVQSIVQVASAAFLKKHANVVPDFLEDYIIGLNWFLDPKNNEEAVKITAEFTKLPLRLFKDFAFTKLDFYRSPTATPDIEALQRNIDLMHELGVIRRKVDVKPHVDLSYLNEAKKRLGLK